MNLSKLKNNELVLNEILTVEKINKMPKEQIKVLASIIYFSESESESEDAIEKLTWIKNNSESEEIKFFCDSCVGYKL